MCAHCGRRFGPKITAKGELESPQNFVARKGCSTACRGALIAEAYAERCCRCKETKDRAAFNKQTASSDGLHSYCRDCSRRAHKEPKPWATIEPGHPRLCPRCGEKKPATSEFFHKDKNSRLGLAGFCKVCAKAKAHTHYWSVARDKLLKPKAVEVLPSGFKRCNRCQIVKLFEAFNRDAPKPNGRSRRCKACEKELRAVGKPPSVVIPEGRKKCGKCQQVKRLDDFHKYKKSRDGRAQNCRVCKTKSRGKVRQTVGELNRYHAPIGFRFCANLKCPESNPQNISNFYKLGSRFSGLCKKCKVVNNRVYGRLRRSRLYNSAGSHTQKDVLAKLELQGGLCYYCSAKLTEADHHVDHKIPISNGGTQWPANICCACPRCNQRKGSKNFWEFLSTTRTEVVYAEVA